jgi:Ran GTPase-activating protein (RanGAP) involved in mRNA processing and transport
MSDPNDSTSTGDDDSLSPEFLEFCANVRNNDPSVLPEFGRPFRIVCRSGEKEDIELADALLENNNVKYLELHTTKYRNLSAEAMAEYVRTSKHLQRIDWLSFYMMNDPRLQHHEEMFCCFLPALQESTSLKELRISFPREGGLSNLALENMLTHTQSLRSLTLCRPDGLVEDMAVAVAVAAASSGLKNNITLRELTLEVPRVATNISPILTSLRDHPLLRSLCLRGLVVDLTGLETLLLSDTSKITELEIDRYNGSLPATGLMRVLEALAYRPTLTKLRLRYCALGRDEMGHLRTVLRNTPSLQSLDLARNDLGSAGLREIAPALHHNTSIKQLYFSGNRLNDMESAEGLRDILRRNKTITTLGLCRNGFGHTNGAVERIADGLGSNSTLTKIDLTCCELGDGGVSILTQTLGSRNTTLQKLALGDNSITSTGVGMLLEMMEQSSNSITDLDLQNNPIENEGASLLAGSLGNNALPNLTRLCLSDCEIDDDGFIELVSALEQNTSLLHLDLRDNDDDYFDYERAFWALAASLPEIKVLQEIDLSWCRGLASAMPLLLVGLRKNTSLFRFYVTDCVPRSVPPTTEETARCAGGWMQEMEGLGYRNRLRSLMRTPKDTLPPRGVWSHALARVVTFPDVIFDVLCSKPSLVPSEDAEGKEVAEDTSIMKKRKHGDE